MGKTAEKVIDTETGEVIETPAEGFTEADDKPTELVPGLLAKLKAQGAALLSWEDFDAALDLDEHAWRSDQIGPGAKVMGTVIDVKSRTSEFGDYPMFRLLTSDGEAIVVVHAFHTVLRSGLAKAKPGDQ